MLRILPLMVDHPLERTRPDADRVEEGFLADLMPALLGNEVPMKEGRFAVLCNGGSQLGKDFKDAWNAVRAAADDPTAGVLSNAVEDVSGGGEAHREATSRRRSIYQCNNPPSCHLT
jgi:hypothetical protein